MFLSQSVTPSGSHRGFASESSKTRQRVAAQAVDDAHLASKQMHVEKGIRRTLKESKDAGSKEGKGK